MIKLIPYSLQFIAGIAVLVAAMSFKSIDRPVHGQVKIQLEFYVGNEKLVLDTFTYKNNLGQLYTISKFKCYLSNISLIQTNKKEFTTSEYYLVDEDDVDSKVINLENVPSGEYSSINITIGVDSIHNCSGVQSGALDPVKGMFWAWNTGYIFMKLEGHSPESKSPGNIFEYHIGGFKEPNNCIRTVTLKFEKSTLSVLREEASVIKIKVDLSEILKTPTTVDFPKLSSVTDFNNATKIADNYKDMFTIIEVK